MMNHAAHPLEQAPALAAALFTTTQQRLLALLYGEPERSFYFKELLRKTGLGVATVKRELDRMVESGLLTRTVRGNQHHYQANPACPIHDEMAAIVRKTLGIPQAIREALEPLTNRIAQAFIFGSFAAGTDRPGSDIDLLVVGDVTLAELARVLYPPQETLAREINPKLYRPMEWQRMVADDDAFARELLRKPRIALIGEAA